MNKLIGSVVMFSIVCTVSGCIGIKDFQRVYKKSMSLEDAIAEKEKIDATDNPAKKTQIENSLKDRLISVSDIRVREIVTSTDIDYSYCVIAETDSPKGIIDFYIYSKNLSDIAVLERGKSKIAVFGYFRRFFKLIDNTWVKIDIGDADIKIVEQQVK